VKRLDLRKRSVYKRRLDKHNYGQLSDPAAKLIKKGYIMKNFIKIIIVALAIGIPVAAYAADAENMDEPAHGVRHAPLGSSSITVGCTGTGTYIKGVLGKLMRGPTHLNEVIVHKHPGITIDLLPADPGNANHFQGSWLQYKGPSVECVFLERLNPVPGGIINFMTEVIRKAYKQLKKDGRLIIQLAPESGIKAGASKEELQEIRKLNPFLGMFNQSAQTGIESYIKTRKGDAIVEKTLRFYDQKVVKLFQDAHKGENPQDVSQTTYDQYYSPTLVITRDSHPKGSEANELGNHILRVLLALMGVFKQENLMIEHLTELGFINVSLEWLDAGHHPYNPSGGFFITATKA
jgi:hypothetical protein